jgi:hypothetical protein
MHHKYALLDMNECNATAEPAIMKAIAADNPTHVGTLSFSGFASINTSTISPTSPIADPVNTFCPELSVSRDR